MSQETKPEVKPDAKPDVKRTMSRGTSKGSYGVSSPSGIGQSSRSTKQTAQVAEFLNGAGTIIEGTTKGSKTVVSEEFHAGPTLPANSALEAIDGQCGQDLVTSHGKDEKEGDYATTSKERTLYPGGDLNPAATP